jgi:nitroreductase
MDPTQTLNAIETRKSTRTFLETPLIPADLEKISSYLNDPKNLVGPYDNKVEFVLVIETETQKKEKIGTYGFIENAQGYIIGSSTKNTQSLFDYAFVLENIVLYLTTLGVGTCWLGGRFRKQHAMSHLSLSDNEVIPAIVPIGYPSKKPRLRDRAVRTVLKARKRKPEDQLFFYETFEQPLGDRAGDLQQALYCLRIAPSAQNKQPWRLVFNTNLSQVHFYVTSPLGTHPLYMCDPAYLDIGIAYNHFKASLDESGITGKLVIEEPEIQKPQGY